MAGQIKMNAGDLRNSANIITTKNQELSEALSNINRTITNLVANSWKGDAATKASEKMEAFISKTFAQYTQAVDEYVTFINNTANTYDSAEDINVANANQQMDSSAVGNFD